MAIKSDYSQDYLFGAFIIMSFIEILVCGDVCPTASNRELFESGNTERLFGNLLPEFLAADYRTVNLECALTHTNNPIFKGGPNLKETPDCINGIAKLGINLVSMSNNHILDFGQNGLADTIKAVESKSIDWVGVGANSEDARRVLYKDIKGKKVAFIAVGNPAKVVKYRFSEKEIIEHEYILSKSNK